MLLFVRRWRRWLLHGGWGWPGRWVQRWLVGPILARNTCSLEQWKQWMVAAAGFWHCLSWPACVVLLASQLLAPSWTVAFHPHLSCACCNFPWVRVDTECLEEGLKASLVHTGNTFLPVVRKRVVSGESMVWHTDYVFRPAELWLWAWCRCLACQLGWGLLCRVSILATWYWEAFGGWSCGSGSSLACFW